MISRPNTVYPTNQSVDANKQNIFTFQFIGDIMSAYQITVVDSTNYQNVYTGQKKTETAYNGDTVQAVIPAASFKNGNDYLWKVTIWQSNPTILVVNGVVQTGSTTDLVKIRQHPQLKVNMYLKIGANISKITAYNIETGVATVSPPFGIAPTANTSYSIMTDFIESAYFFFSGRSTAIVNIPEIGTLASRKLIVRPTYAQLDGTPIKYQRYVLTTSNGEVVDDTGELPTSNLEYQFDGLVSGQTYVLNWGVITQDDMTAETQRTFYVNYAPPRIDFPPDISFVPEKNAVLIKWFEDMQSFGEATGGGRGEGWDIVQNFPFTGTNSVRILKGDIIYDKINGEPIKNFESTNEYFVAISTVLNPEYNGKVLEVSNENSRHFINISSSDITETNPNGETKKIAEVYSKKDSAVKPSLSEYQEDTFYYIPEGIMIPEGYFFIASGIGVYQNNSFKFELSKKNNTYNANVTKVPLN